MVFSVNLILYISKLQSFFLFVLGLNMHLLETRGTSQYFAFEHNKEYRDVQFQFLDAVESLNPQNIVVSTMV